jgi:hypothetical protein
MIAALSPSVSPCPLRIAGSLGGLTEACLLQPMDVVKTRLQLDRAGKYTGEQCTSASTSYSCVLSMI